MPRKPRVEYAGAIYHVMSRGNRGDAIFLDDKDHETFIDTLDEACTKTGWLVHAFVLMGNHYHLLLETPEANLVEGMKWLSGTYTQRFNSRHKLWGHLLQGRYKAIPVDQGAGGDYFPTVANYIHLNPARTKAFDLEQEKLTDYRWSSYPLYLRPSKRPSWLVVDRVLGALGVEDGRTGRAWYREYMNKRVLEIARSDDPLGVDAAWEKIRRGWYFGSDGFRQELMERLDVSLKGKRTSSFSGEAVREHNEMEAARLIEQGLGAMGVVHDELESMRKGAPEKMALVWLLKKITVVKNEWISRHLFCGHPANIPGYVRKVDEAEEGRLAEYKKILKSED
jgi:REP element-mobilizing transposase RayT